MACFIAPAVEAIAVTATYAIAKNKEQKLTVPSLENSDKLLDCEVKVSFSKKLSWLLSLLWGGVLLLAFEHFWHGEIQPFAPFITAMSNPEDTTEMLHEMATVGVSMAISVTVVWGIICAFADAKVKSIKKAMAKGNA